MNSRISDLQKAVDYVRNTFAERRILLDYSTESIRHLDKLFDQEFKNGKLKNPEGGFAKFQGVILIGVTGYLSEVIIKNTRQTQTEINEQDENWFISFKITAGGNRFVQPGQQILKRIQYGSDVVHTRRRGADWGTCQQFLQELYQQQFDFFLRFAAAFGKSLKDRWNNIF